MPGFLSEYDETTTLKFGADEQWWVKVRKYLPRGAFKAAQAVLVSPVMRYVGENDAETKGDVDTVGYQNELVYAAIEDWNLTDRDGVVLPLAPEAAKRESIDLLPEDVFEKIVGVIEAATPRRRKEGEPDDGKDKLATFPAKGDARPVRRGASAG